MKFWTEMTWRPWTKSCLSTTVRSCWNTCKCKLVLTILWSKQDTFTLAELRLPRGMSLRDGDIANSHLRSALICPGNACLWPKAIDGFVYVPYLISPVYGTVWIHILNALRVTKMSNCYFFCHGRWHGQNHHRGWDAGHFLRDVYKVYSSNSWAQLSRYSASIWVSPAETHFFSMPLNSEFMSWCDVLLPLYPFFCCTLQAAGHFWDRLEEIRFCPCRPLGACGQGWLRTSWCTLWVLCTSSLALTETTTSRLCGRTSWQVRMNDHMNSVLKEFKNYLAAFSVFLTDQLHNFRKQVTNNLNSPYDYGSLMHYGRWAAL